MSEPTDNSDWIPEDPPADDWFDSFEPPESDPYLEQKYNSSEIEIPEQETQKPGHSIIEDVRLAWFEVAAYAVNSDVNVAEATQALKSLKEAALYNVLSEDETDVLKRTMGHVSGVLNGVQKGDVNLASLGLLTSVRVQDDVKKCLEGIAKTAPAKNAYARLSAANSDARKEASRRAAQSLSRSIIEGEDPDSLADAYEKVLGTPPIALSNGQNASSNGTVADMFIEDQDGGAAYKLHISSGFRTLDKTLHTRAGTPVQLCESGQLVVFVAPSGSGKTSAFNTLVVAGVQDIVNQGHLGRTMYFHNEDDTVDIFKQMQLGPGGRFKHLAESIVARKTTSRSEVCETFYTEVLAAKRKSEETGLDIKKFMPGAIYVDYFQAWTNAEDKGNENVSTTAAANLLLYGFANCAPGKIAEHGGVSYEQFTGESWPAGLEGYEIAVLTAAQLLLKGESSSKPFTKDKDWRHYAADNGMDIPMWEVLPGDKPMSKQNDIRGTTTIIQHATTIIGLHRPKVANNPKRNHPAKVFGMEYETLVDNRAYMLILKARYGQQQVVVPMEFNLQRNGGSKAQYFDSLTEEAIDKGVARFAYCKQMFQNTGDPLIPMRGKAPESGLISY